MQQIKTSGTKMKAESEDIETKKSSSTFVETTAGQIVRHLSIHKTDDSVLQPTAGKRPILESDKSDKTDFPSGTKFIPLIHPLDGLLK
jgi:hypothetical protein